MSVRSGLRFPLVPVDSAPVGSAWVGHGCGPIAPVAWLVARPAQSVVVSRWLASACGGFWDRCACASELDALSAAGGALSRPARRLLGWWVRAGRPMPWLSR
jgi:hypothetical protein